MNACGVFFAALCLLALNICAQRPRFPRTSHLRINGRFPVTNERKENRKKVNDPALLAEMKQQKNCVIIPHIHYRDEIQEVSVEWDVLRSQMEHKSQLPKLFQSHPIPDGVCVESAHSVALSVQKGMNLSVMITADGTAHSGVTGTSQMSELKEWLSSYLSINVSQPAHRLSDPILHSSLCLVRLALRLFGTDDHSKDVTFTDQDGMDLGWPLSDLTMVRIATIEPENVDLMRKIISRPLRIFQIGFNKAGTTTIANLFENTLNFNNDPDFPSQKHRFVMHHLCRFKCAKVFQTKFIRNAMEKSVRLGYKALCADVFEKATVLTDFQADPWRVLSEHYPYSLFILNIRTISRWLLSKMMHKNGMGGSLNAFIARSSIYVSKMDMPLMKQRLKYFLDGIPQVSRMYAIAMHSYLSLRKQQFYKHSCLVMDHFQNHDGLFDHVSWNNNRLLVINIEESDFNEQLLKFVQPYYYLDDNFIKRLKKNINDNNKIGNNKTYMIHSNIATYNPRSNKATVNAYLDWFNQQWKQMTDNSNDTNHDGPIYSEYAVSECICRKVFDKDVRYPPWNEQTVHFNCDHWTIPQLKEFMFDPLYFLW